MQQEKSNLTLNRKLILSLVIFSISYVIFLFLWVEIKNNYGRVLLSTASHLTAKVLDIDFDTIKKNSDEVFGAQFYIARRGKGYSNIVNFDFSLFTYNAPLTLAIMAAFFLFIKNHVRSYIEVLIILFVIHLLYIFLYEVYSLLVLFAKHDLESVSRFKLFIWYSLWGFFQAMLIRFEPFLIGIYLYLRFSKPTFIPIKQ